MKSDIICGLCVLLGTLIILFTATYAIPVNTDRNQRLMDHLANLKPHVQSPLVRKLLEAVKESTEDVKVAVFVQDLLDSQAQNVTDLDWSSFGWKEAVAAFAALQSLPEMAQAQLIFSSIALLAAPMVLTCLCCCLPLLCGCCA